MTEPEEREKLETFDRSPSFLYHLLDEHATEFVIVTKSEVAVSALMEKHVIYQPEGLV